MTSKRHRQPLEVMSSLNITNLLDTAFILLITFMLIAPQLTHGLKINLPKVSDPANLPPQNSSKTVTILIEKQEAGRAEEKILIARGTDTPKRFPIEEVRSTIEKYLEEEPELVVIVKGDEQARFGISAAVLTAVSKAGIEKIGIRTVPRIDEK